MKFTKMQGLGNDYVYVNCMEQMVEDAAETARRVSDETFRDRIRRADLDLPV